VVWVLAVVVGVLGATAAGPAGADQANSSTQRVAAASITTGDSHTCALLATGAVRCWGYGGDGELGHNTTTNVGDGRGADLSIREAGNVPVGGTAVAITAGDFHTCALLATGAVRCWGSGGVGQLGHNSTTNVGDGEVGDLSIKAAGDVPVGGRVRVKATTGLSATIRPTRDRDAPYVYRITGDVHGRFVADAATCTGRVKVTIHHGQHRLDKHTSRLGAHCGYRAKMRVTADQLHIERTARLTIKIHYLGSKNLKPTSTSRHVKVG